MLIVCPNCKKRFELDDLSAEESKKLRCSSCRAVFRLVRKGALPTTAPSSATAPAAATPPASASAAPGSVPATPAPAHAPATAPAPAAAAATATATAPNSGSAARLKVVVANESLAFCEAVRKVLATEPFELFVCTDGKEALDTVERVRPELLLLDVALPTMFGFEVCERVRQNPALSGVKIVLIASIYDKTRYKRSPNSLYGADDYIEKHHIPDALVPMIYRLASGSVTASASPSWDELEAQEQTRAEIRQAEVSATQEEPELNESPEAESGGTREAAVVVKTRESAELSEVQLKARRLARIIVSDISLYNQGKVEQGVRDGSFYGLLADDIREGEQLYRQRVPEEVRESTSYLTDAFEDLIAKKRAELRI